MSEARVIGKIIKRLRSPDDNDKLAALAYLTKAFPTPTDLFDSASAPDIWAALRSTQFLERALRSPDVRSLVFSILSVFSRVCPPRDLHHFIPLLLPFLSDDFSAEPAPTLIEISACLDDISVLFDFIRPTKPSLPFFTKVLSAARALTLTAHVFRARAAVFSLLTGRDGLPLREQLFRLLAAFLRLNDSFAIYASPNAIDLADFLAAERLAFIELRLQLDLPVRDPGLDGAGAASPFSQEIGRLVNPGLSAAACELLGHLLCPLTAHEGELADADIGRCFDAVDAVLHGCLEVVRAADGAANRGRAELRCLLALLGQWLRDAPFLCAHAAVAGSAGALVALLSWFPREALHFVPAFAELAARAADLRAAGFAGLARKMAEFATEDEARAIDAITGAVYGPG